MLKVGFRVRLLVVKTFRGGKYVLSGSAPPAEAVVHDVTRGFLAQRRASNHIFKHHPPTHNTHTHTHTHIYIYIYINAHTRTSMHTHTHTHIYIYIHKCTHTHTHAHTHTHTRTHTVEAPEHKKSTW